MNIKSKIKCLNIVIGCTFDCPYCYARNSARRFFMTEDFSKPIFRERLLKRFDTRTANTYLLTGMSDPADWKEEWMEQVFAAIARNPQHDYLFLTKRPQLLSVQTQAQNVWLGTTVTRQSELWRMQALKEHSRAQHYHVTFEPLFEPIEGIDFTLFDWAVIGTETGNRRGKVTAQPAWVNGIVAQADRAGVPVFMKEELCAIMGEGGMRQQLPAAFCKR